jgi:hypothetical protein
MALKKEITRFSTTLGYLSFGLMPLFFPLVLSNNPRGAILNVVAFLMLFFLPGYFFLRVVGSLSDELAMLASPVLGMEVVTTLYDIFARRQITDSFVYLMAIFLAPVIAFTVMGKSSARNPVDRDLSPFETAVAGSLVTLSLAPLYWRSGRLSGGSFVFYGPAGQDPLFHVTLVQRLLHHVPPDNFMVSGLRAPIYHYFNDLMLALTFRFSLGLHLGTTDLFDLFFRVYPSLCFFLLGALAYRLGRELLGTQRAGILSVLLLLGGGGPGWFLGALQTIIRTRQSGTAVRAAFFTNWTSWDGLDSILPLIHRPAHYQGLMMCLTAINILLLRERCRRHWMVAGLVLGLMAGFNFTLCATVGLAAVTASVLSFLRDRQSDARDLAWLSLFILIGSLPVTGMMLMSGFHYPAAGAPFRGPTLEFAASIWGGLVTRILPSSLGSWVSFILLPLALYGIKLFGIGAMARSDLGNGRRAIANVFAITFGVSFITGAFLASPGSSMTIAFLQPTLWILGLFSLRPIDAWLERNAGTWGPFALWAILGLTWAQGLIAFNFSHKVSFDRDSAEALRQIHCESAPDEVVAYLPSGIVAAPIWGDEVVSTNFAIMGMTGLDGYFPSEPYFVFFAVPGLPGGNTAEVLLKAKRLYEQRRDDTEAFIRGEVTEAGLARLKSDHVRWIVVSADALRKVRAGAAPPWRTTAQMVVYRLP